MWQMVKVIISQACQARVEWFSKAVLVLDKGNRRALHWTPDPLTVPIPGLCLPLRATDRRVQTEYSKPQAQMLPHRTIR